MEHTSSLGKKIVQLGIHRVVAVRTVEDLISGLRSKNKARVGERGQLPLNSPDTDINTASDLTNEESLIRRTVQSAQNATSGLAEKEMPERSIVCSHYENNCTQYENKKLQLSHDSHSLKFTLGARTGTNPEIQWTEWKQARSSFAEGHFNLKPVLPLDEEFNPQTGCVAGLNYGDYKTIELPMERRLQDLGLLFDRFAQRAASGIGRTLSCSPWLKKILAKPAVPIRAHSLDQIDGLLRTRF